MEVLGLVILDTQKCETPFLDLLPSYATNKKHSNNFGEHQIIPGEFGKNSMNVF